MFKSWAKTLPLVTAWCVLLMSGYLNAFAQCDSVYTKTITRKILPEKMILFDYYQEYHKDFTGDGKVDLIGFVTPDVDITSTKLVVLPANGAGDFDAPIQTILPSPILPRSENLKIADFNSDGKYDFITITPQAPKTLTVFRNNGNGTFTTLASTVLNNETVTGIFDVNNDGLADLTVRKISTSDYFYRQANADGSFGTGVSLVYGQHDLAADFNGDGKKDFPAIEAQSGNYNLRIYNNMGNGTFTLNSGSSLIANALPTLSSVSDFNNDGKPDLLVYVNSSSGSELRKMAVMMNQGNGSFTRIELEIPGVTSYAYLAAKDFNGDNFQDIFLYSYISSTRNGYWIYTNNGAGGFTRRVYTNSEVGYPVSDFDGDNKADFIRVNSNRNNYTYPQLFDDSVLLVGKNVCNRTGQTRIVDFDGDGLPDMAFWRADGRWRVSGRNFPYQASTFNWGQAGDVPVPGDYDGDGKTDYAVFRPSTGAWYYVNSSNGSYSGVAFGASEDKPVPADYNGDGKTDVAVYRPSTGVWYVLYSGTNQFYGAAFGASEDKPVPEDYDGDGKTDFAVFRPSTGFWYVLKSSDTSFFAVAWGIETDTRVPTDYDGDGKADIAVVRSGTNNIWYIRRTNGAPNGSFTFGIGSDIIQPSDWDGNEIWDMGIFRSSNGYWYSSHYPISFANIAPPTGEVPISSLNIRY